MFRAIKTASLMVIVAAASGILLSAASSFLSPKIEAHRREAMAAALRTVSPEAFGEPEKRTGTLDGRAFDLYILKKENGETAGYAFEAAGLGFAGEIVLMVGVSADFERMTGMQILESIESPGLGDKIKSDEWREQFRGMRIAKDFTVVKIGMADPGKGEIQAITASTISSKAVAAALAKGITKARKFALDEGILPAAGGTE